MIDKFEAYSTQHCSFNFGMGHDLAGRLGTRSTECPKQDSLCIPSNALASNALYRYRNAVWRNCNALFDFQLTLFDVLDNLVFAVS